MSARRKVPVFGQPSGVPVSASTCSIVMSIACMTRMAFISANVPMRLAMKLGVSFAKTIDFPRRRSANCSIAAMAAGSVSGVGMISSSRMYRGGLKK